MRTAQRGSVLLTAIAGILILAVIGTVMVSLMTSSVMTVVDGRETLQATYLAESGKEIARARTAKLSGGALMNEAESLEKENGGKGFAVADKGFAKLSLYPSWFRYNGETLKTAASGWYGEAPTGKVELLFINKDGAKRYRYSASAQGMNPAAELGSQGAADVYLIGRVSDEAHVTYKGRTLTVTGYSGFEFFPETGGLIGLISHQGNVDNIPSTKVSDQRFTYDAFTYDKGSNTATFTNLTPLSDKTVSQDTFKDKDIVLGQYFRVVCEATTDNGARAALVWHTNGRNSLRFGDGGGTGGEEGAVGGSNAKDLVDIFGGTVSEDKGGTDKDDGMVTGDNILGRLEAEDYYDKDDKDDKLAWKFDHKGTNPYDIEINHFLKKEKQGSNHEYWSVAVARQWLSYDKGKNPPLQSMMQYSFKGDDGDKDDYYFTGILCRLGFVKSSETVSSEGSVWDENGAQGIGVGVLHGIVNLSYKKNQNKYVVDNSSVNPALLPGFYLEKDKEKGKAFIISPEDKDTFYGNHYNELGLLGKIESKDGGNKIHISLYPLLVVWAYDDLESVTGPGIVKTLRPLAVFPLSTLTEQLTLTVKVVEKEGKNYLNVWCWKTGDTRPDWATKRHSPVSFLAYRAAGIETADRGQTLIVPFATGENYRRVGIFAEVYRFNGMAEHEDIEIEGFFFTGTGTGTGELTPGGLTPGITD